MKINRKQKKVLIVMIMIMLIFSLAYIPTGKELKKVNARIHTLNKYCIAISTGGMDAFKEALKKKVGKKDYRFYVIDKENFRFEYKKSEANDVIGLFNILEEGIGEEKEHRGNLLRIRLGITLSMLFILIMGGGFLAIGRLAKE